MKVVATVSGLCAVLVAFPPASALAQPGPSLPPPPTSPAEPANPENPENRENPRPSAAPEPAEVAPRSPANSVTKTPTEPAPATSGVDRAARTVDSILKFYGFVRLDVIVDSATFNNPQSPITVARLQPGVPDPGAEFSMHPRLSRLGVDLQRVHASPEVDVDGKIEIDFQNGGRESRAIPRMRHAYVQVSWREYRLLFGQTWQTVSRLVPMANADTLMWGAGNTGDRSPQLRLSRVAPLGDGQFSLEAAAQSIGTIDGVGQAGLDFGALPAAQARAALKLPLWTAEPFQVAVGVHYAREKIVEKVAGRSDFEQLGGFGELVVPFFAKTGVRGEAFLGKNLSDLRGGIVQGINPVRDLEIHARGGWAELYSDPVPWLGLGLGAGFDDPDDRDLENGQATLNRAAWAVTHFRLLGKGRIGVEYLVWVTDYKAEPRRLSNRVDTHLQWEL